MPRLSDSEKEFISSQMPLDAAPAEPARDAQGAHLIDARGISSPLPLLRAHRALRGMQPGQLLKVTTTGQHTVAEFQALVKYVTGYELLSQDERNGEVVHLLRRRR